MNNTSSRMSFVKQSVLMGLLVFPTVFAHELMAREWIYQVSFRLKFLKKYKL